MSERGACEVVGISRSVYHYQPDELKDDAVITVIHSVIDRYPTYGFSKVFTVLRREGHPWNHKREYRLYNELNLNTYDIEVRNDCLHATQSHWPYLQH